MGKTATAKRFIVKLPGVKYPTDTQLDHAAAVTRTRSYQAGRRIMARLQELINRADLVDDMDRSEYLNTLWGAVRDAL